jgi:Sporulation and spore germination
MYWLSAASPNSLEPTAIQLPLSADPVERSRQLLNALITRAPGPEKRTLPAEASLLAFYIQPDGSAIADFSDEISSGMPSGILSEQLAVESIAETLGANVIGIRRLKILVHGQEAEALAGHVDLYGLFPVPSPAPAAAPGSAPSVSSGATPAAPSSKSPSATGAGQHNVPVGPAPPAKSPGKPVPH